MRSGLHVISNTIMTKNFLRNVLSGVSLVSACLASDCEAQHDHGGNDGRGKNTDLLSSVDFGLLNRHPMTDEYYLHLIESDKDDSIAGYLLELVKSYDPASKPDPELLKPTGDVAAVVAARFFGHRDDFRKPLMDFVGKAESFRRSIDASYGDRLIDGDAVVVDLLRSLMKNPERGAVDAVIAIGEKGGLPPRGRLLLYNSLADRYESHPEEREAIRAGMEKFIKTEANAEVLDTATRYNYFSVVMNDSVPVGPATAPIGGPAQVPEQQNSQENKKVEQNSVSEASATRAGETADTHESEKKNPATPLWVGIFIGSAALIAGILYKSRKKPK